MRLSSENILYTDIMQIHIFIQLSVSYWFDTNNMHKVYDTNPFTANEILR